MLSVEGYSVKEQLYEGKHYIVYRAERLADHKKVILKTCRSERPTLSELAALQNEYQLLKPLKLPGVIQAYELVESQHRLMLVSEDIGGETLHQYLKQQSLALNDFFKIALSLAEALSGLHLKHIIYKALNPHNIIIQPVSLRIQLIDFNNATQLQEESTDSVLLNRLEGHLAYLSPEQTGRMNRPLDYRTDFYSLGVTFFEMLTGQLPFEGKDALEIIHKHLAQPPPLASKANPQVPNQLAALVVKLLAKIPEERYASASGVKADLLECQLQWQAKQQIEPFSLGQQDVYHCLSISHKLYGREAQVQQLLLAFKQAAEGQVELFLVTGYSGIGKSSVIKEIHKPVVQHKAYFISGKYDQLQRAIPYSALISAFQELVKQLLSEPEEHFIQVRQRLLKAVGNNGQVIINILPAMELIIGQQPPINELPPLESQNRFTLTFQNLIRALAEPEHPLVIFLDDLQWIDGASLELVRVLLTDTELKHLFIIGAYRDNEVGLDHPLASALEQLKQTQVKINQIRLEPLGLIDIKNLLADSLNASLGKVEPLAKLLLEKTLGNPFFMIAFLKNLYQRSLLRFSYETSHWEWDINQLRQQDFTDNVVDLLVTKIQVLPDNVQAVLKLASCLGHAFDFKTLMLISETPRSLLARSLWSAIAANLIIPLNEEGNVIFSLSNDQWLESLDLGALHYQFVHDRVQQAAYQLIPEDEHASLHLKIGRFLRKDLQENSQRLFEILDHFNEGIHLITDPQERHQLAAYNLIAGKKAKHSNAYWAAQDYLGAGLDLLKPFDWESDQPLIFNLYQELATCHYLTANHEDAQTIFKELLQRTSNTVQKLTIYRLMCEMLSTLNQHQQAIDLAITALKLVGVRFPKNPQPWHVLLAVLKIKWKIGTRKIQQIDILPMKNEIYQSTIALINQSLNSVYFINQNLYGLCICEDVKLTLTYGYTIYITFVAYALILMHALHQYKEAIAFVELYNNLQQRYGLHHLEGRNLVALAAFIDVWRYPLAEVRYSLLRGYDLAYQAGDLVYSNYANIFLFGYSFMAGKSLNETESDLQKQLHFYEKTKTSERIVGYPTHIACLMGKKSFDIQEIILEEALLPQGQATVANFFYSAGAKICFLFNCYEQAVYLGDKHWQYAKFGMGIFSNTEGYFYYALALMARYDLDQSLNLKPIKKIHKIFQRWAKWCPVNYLHYRLLLEAEMARLKGDRVQAMDLYEQAIEKAYEQSAFSIVGIAYECAARFYQQLNKPLFAKACMQDAHYAYQQWGALGKCRSLEKQYPKWLHSIAAASPFDSLSGVETSLGNLDILSIFKFTQALSSEIQLDKLLQKLLTVLLQTAGAQRVVLLVKNGEQWFVEAEGSNAEQQIHLLGTQLMDERSDLPIQLLQYAQRTRELILLQDNQDAENIQAADIYLAETNPQSVLVLPIFYQAQLKSLLYLENRLVSHAFSPEHIQTLKLLASQAAISLENARLFYQATHDALTGLANRNLLYQTFNLTTSKNQRKQDKLALLFMDLDGFKRVNDTLGHEVGDKLLRYFAEQLKACLRGGDLAVRLGGDEFVVMLENVQDLSQIIGVAERLLQGLKEPAVIQEHRFLVSTSIGISLYPDNAQDIETLLKQADIALYRVKAQGKGHYQFYEQAIH